MELGWHVVAADELDARLADTGIPPFDIESWFLYAGDHDRT